MASTSGTLLALITYLVCVSTVLSLTFAGDVSQIVVGQPQIEPRSQTTDFRAYSNISELSIIVESGAWNVSTTKGLYSIESTSGWWIFNRPTKNTIVFTDLLSNDSTFTNTYHIKNPNLNDIDIITVHEYSKFFAPLYWEAQIRDNGIKYETHFYNTSKLSEFNITTTFDYSSNHIQISLEDTVIIDEIRNVSYLLSSGSFYAGGISAYGNDTQLISLSSYVVPPTVTEATTFKMSEFLNLIAMLFFWTVPSHILPIYLNVVFIKVPLIALIFIIIQTFRGTG